MQAKKDEKTLEEKQQAANNYSHNAMQTDKRVNMEIRAKTIVAIVRTSLIFFTTSLLI